MRMNVNELLISLSQALNFAEEGVLNKSTNHGVRVAYISGRIAQVLSMPEENLFDLISYSLLHDNGVMNALLEIPVRSTFRTGTNPAHCVEGEKNIAEFPFLHRERNVILYHHEHYDGSGFFGVSGRDIPLYSRVIALSDKIALLYSGGMQEDDIVSRVQTEARIFDPVVREAFLELSGRVEFWLGMNDQFVQGALAAMLPRVYRRLEFQEIRSVSQIFSRIIDAKSPFTGSHSRGISEKVGKICSYYEFDGDTYWKMRIAADLHDLGKLIVPNEILDKPGRLTPQEFRVVQAHPYYTRKLLEMINGFEEITEWASNHHEKLDGSGYPYGFGEDRLDFNSRILACVDIYQALTEDRPYRKGMSHGAAVRIMQEMARDGLIESAVVEDIDSLFPAESRMPVQ